MLELQIMGRGRAYTRQKRHERLWNRHQRCLRRAAARTLANNLVKSKLGPAELSSSEKLGDETANLFLPLEKNPNVPSIRFYYWFLKTLNTWRSSNADFSVVVTLARAQLGGT
jgi:hypothetical protein